MRSFSYLKKLWIVLIVFGWITVPSLGFDLGLVLGLALGFLVGLFAGLRLGMMGLQHWNVGIALLSRSEGDYRRSLQCNCRLTGLDLAVS